MADKALSSSRDDLLSSFGTTAKDVYQKDTDEEAIPEEESQEAQAEETPEPEPQPEVEAAEEEAPDDDELQEYSPEDLVAMASRSFQQQEAPQQEPQQYDRGELDRLKQEVNTLRSILGDRVNKSEQELRQPAQEEEEEEPNWQSPEIIRMVAQHMGVDEEEAARIVPVFGTMAEYVAQNKFGKEVSSLKERLQKEEEMKNREREMQGYWNNLSTALQFAAKRGGIEEAIVKDFLQNRGGSLLTRHLQKFPYKLNSPEGVVDAVVSVARGVQLMDAERRSKGEQSEGTQEPIVGSKEEVMGALKKARNKATPTKPTEDEEFLDAVMNAGVGAKGKLPKGFFG